MFLTVTRISESTKSTFSIVISGNGTPKSKRSDPGPKIYAIITMRNANGITPLAMNLAFDGLLTSIFYSCL